MRKFFKILRFILILLVIVVFLICLISVTYVKGIDEGTARESEKSNFYQQIDLQESYGCCVTFEVDGENIIEKFSNGYQRVIFDHAYNVDRVVLGPELKTLHFVIDKDGEMTSSCIDVKSDLPDYPTVVDLTYRGLELKMPSPSMPWHFNYIIDHSDNSYEGGRELLPRACGNQSILFTDGGGGYLVYLEGSFDAGVTGAAYKLVFRNIKTGTELTSEVGFSDFGQWSLSPRLTKSSISYNWNYYAYPDFIEELKDYYLVQFGPQLITVDKKYLSLVHSVNLPSLGEFDGPSCGGPGVDHVTNSSSNIVVLVTNYCSGLGYDGLLDFSDSTDYTYTKLDKFVSTPYITTEINLSDKFATFMIIKSKDVTAELNIDESKLCAQSDEEVKRITDESIEELNKKYEGRNAQCYFCGQYSGCYIDEPSVIYNYSNGRVGLSTL